MKEGKGRGKEREAPTHLIEISKLTHAARITKNRQNCKVCSQEKLVFVAHSYSVRHNRGFKNCSTSE